MSTAEAFPPVRHYIPDVDENTSTLDASLAYGAAGLYHGPTDYRTKRPAKALGNKWQARTFTDEAGSYEWFVGTSYGVFLHPGRTGLVFFDVDDPATVPPILRDAILRCAPPCQTTRDGEAPVNGIYRGHYLFANPPGKVFSNSTGRLGKGWGEVRGRNGLIVVAPSVHEKADRGGFYRWRQTGPIPVLPDEIADLLVESFSDGDSAATDEEVSSFYRHHTAGSNARKFAPVLESLERAGQGDRHEAAVEAACWAMREARAGFYSASWAMQQLEAALNAKVAGERNSRVEFRGIAAWAVAQAKAETADRIARIARSGTSLAVVAAHDIESIVDRTPTRKVAPMPTSRDVIDDEDDEPEDPGWGPPKSLARYAAPIPTDALGDTLGPMIREVAHTYQVPTDIAVTMALPLVAIAACGRWSVDVRGGWSETVALATISVLGSSGGKSPVLRRLVGPLQEYEREAREDGAVAYREALARYQVLADRAEKLRKEILKTDPAHDLNREHSMAVEAYIAACRDRDECEIPTTPRFMLDDTTPEALAKVMSEQDGAIGIVSDEAGIFGNLGGRYANGQINLDVVLKGVSGTRIQIDRKGADGPAIIDHPVLSFSVAVQPGLMARLGETPQFRESGLLGRFLPVMPVSLMGYRQNDTGDVDPSVDRRWRTKLRALAEKAVALREAGERRSLAVKPDALTKLNELRAELEPEFRDGGKLRDLTDFGGKLAGSTVRIAACLTLLDDPEADAIEAEVMGSAVRVAKGYIDHARTVFSTLAGDDPDTPPGRILKWLEEQGSAAVKRRDVHLAHKHLPWAKRADDVEAIMEVLEAHGYVRSIKVSPVGGGRPSWSYLVNPALLGSPQNPSERV